MTQKRKARSLLAALLAALLLLAALPLSAYATAAPAADGSLTVALDNYNNFYAAVRDLGKSSDELNAVTILTITGRFNNGKAWENMDGVTLARTFLNLDTLDMFLYTGAYSNYAFESSSTSGSTPTIRRIRLPAGVNLSSHMFFNCRNLTTLVCGSGAFEDGVINLTGARGYGEGAFSNCTAITQVRLPAGIAIPTIMFGGCASLTTLVCGDGALEQGVIDLTGYTGGAYGEILFQSCSAIEQVRLPDHIDIPVGMFSKCTSLKGLTFVGSRPNAPSVGQDAFYNVPTGGTLTYPAGATGYDTFGAPALNSWTRVDVDPPAPPDPVDPVAPTPAPPAAEGTPHACDFGDWQYSNEHHWKRCSCMALSDYAPHVFNSARVCTVCGYGARPKKVNPPTGVYDSYMPRLA